MDSFIMDDTEDEEGGVRRFYSSDDEDDDDQDDEDEEGSRTLDESGMTRRRTRKKTYGPEDLVPSTQGGLVIPPFPPLRSRGREGHRDQDQDPNSSASNPGQTAGGPSNSGTGRSFGMTAGRPPLGPRSNSGPYQPPVHQPLSSGFSSGSGGTSGTAGDPTYDQEAAIGGKVLGGKVRPREAEGLLEGIWRLIDEFERWVGRRQQGFVIGERSGGLTGCDWVSDCARAPSPTRDPPFTVQRLCELAVHPRRQHTLLGKYVRALERVLLVTSPFEFPPDRDEHDEGVSGVQPGTDRPGVPPGLALERPLFGLIPFLQPQDGEMAVMPGTSAAAAVGGGATSGMDMGVESSSSSSSFSSSGLPPSGPIESTPTEPFLGRVDELDAGPLIKPSTDPTMVGGTSSQDPHQLHDVKEGGGGVILHGVSDRPRAISSTTDLTGLEGATHQMRGGYRQGMGKNGKTDSDDDSDSDDQPRLGDGDISDTSSTSSLFSSTSPSGRSAGNGRRISRLPRTSSTQSLTDRFVSTGMEVLDPAKEEEVRLSKDGGRTGSGGPDAGHGIKVENDDAIKLEIEDGNEDKKEVGVKDDVELKREEKEDEKTGLPVKIRRVE
jgi:hypothetical protein